MVWALLGLVAGQAVNIDFLSLHYGNDLLKFGFEENGSFDLEFDTAVPGKVYGLFVPVSDSQGLRKMVMGLPAGCVDPSVRVSDLNFSHDHRGGKVRWSGTIPEKGVYSLYFWHCDSARATFNVKGSFSNPKSRLDSRDEILPNLYLFFALGHAFIAGIWALNAACFLNFRVPLHTLFLCLPFIRSVSLMLSRSYWLELRISDQPQSWKAWNVSFLEFAFYSLTFAGLSFASAGFCIFRQKFAAWDRLEMGLSSWLMTGSILMAQWVSDLKQALVLFGAICFGIWWFLKQGIISLIIVITLMKEMESEPQVIAKVRLSRNFLCTSFLTMIGTMFVSSVVAGLDYRQSICATVLEFGLYINSCLQLHFFLLRKQYYGDTEFVEVKRTMRRPILVKEPERELVVIMSHEM
jgi:hypothetical protein